MKIAPRTKSLPSESDTQARKAKVLAMLRRQGKKSLKAAQAKFADARATHTTSWGHVVRSSYVPSKAFIKSQPSKNGNCNLAKEQQQTMEECLNRFYKFNRGQQPLGIKLERFSRLSLHRSRYILAMRNSFLVIISKADEHDGAHEVHLRYLAQTQEQSHHSHWIATAYIEGNFFQQPIMLQKLASLVALKKFYISSLTKQTQIPK